MASRLPIVHSDPEKGMTDWLEPAEVTEAFRIQQRFVCPDWAGLRRTVLATVLPGLVFITLVLPEARARGAREGAEPELAGRSWDALGLSHFFCTVWGIGAVLGLAVAAFRNPGVVPRPPSASSTTQETATVARNPPRCITINGVSVKQRWCNTCGIYRPLRSKHCTHCDRCVFRFDHHCSWLGNCVGLGNYRTFLLLISSATLFFGHSALITGRVLCHDVSRDLALQDAAQESSMEDAGDAGPLWFLRLQGQVEEEAAPHGSWAWRGLRGLRLCFVPHGLKVVYTVYAVNLFLALLILVLYHGIIIGYNLTTNEHVRDYYTARNPFDHRCAKNYEEVFCVPYGKKLPVIRDFSVSRRSGW